MLFCQEFSFQSSILKIERKNTLLSEFTLLLCVEGSTKAFHGDNCVNDCPVRAEPWMLRVVLKRFTVFFTSLSVSLCLSVSLSLNGSLPQCVQWFMSSVTNAAVPVWGLTFTHWLPLFIHVHGCLCVLYGCMGLTKWELDCCLGLLKPICSCLFQSVRGLLCETYVLSCVEFHSW